MDATGESEGDSSDTDSTTSCSSSSGSSVSSAAPPGRRTRPELEQGSVVWETDSHGECISVSCAHNKAKLYRNRFAGGSVGESVLFEGQWMTVNQFQSMSGQDSDWKSVCSNGHSLKQCDGGLTEHSKKCLCPVCNKEAVGEYIN